MSDAVTLQLGLSFIAALFTFLTPIVVGIFGMIARRDAAKAVVKVEEVKQAADQAATKVDEVKHVLEDSTAASDQKLDGLAKVAKATHTLVNSNMGVQLKISAVALRRVADLAREAKLDTAAADEEAAKLAERLYQEHTVKQEAVDAQPGTPAEKQGKA